MKLSIKNATLIVELNRKESLLSMRRRIAVPLKSISRAHSNAPKTVWKELKAPGTFFPGLIKAGTYYTPRGREFWYLERKDKPLVIELKKQTYKRLIIGAGRRDYWMKRIISFL